MPIKLKGFARRKSSGNALEDAENPPQSSFRVFERPSVERKSYSDGNLVSQRLSEGSSPPEDHDNIFAAPENPSFRNLTGSYEGSSNVRFSSSARRSADGPTQFDPQSPHSRNLQDIPLPPFSGALRAAGRTFSFGGRFSKTPTAPLPPQPSSPELLRNRALTTSTAPAPKLLETEFQIGRIGDDFGSMFDDIGKRDTNGSSENMNPSIPNDIGPSYRNEDKASRPTPINTDRSKEVEPSPYSWGSRQSEEGLLAISDSPQENSSLFQSNFNPTSPGGRRKSLPLANSLPITTTSHRSLEKPSGTIDKGLRRSVLYSSRRDSAAVEDDDAKLIMENLYANKRSSQLPFAAELNDSDGENSAPLFNNASTTKRASVPRETPTVRAPDSSDFTEGQFDPSIAVHARLAAQYESKQPLPGASNKIMTPSQFEHYRQQQELKRSNSDASSSAASEESHFDEEDEAEKNREAERQRRKQEAHLSVYRQQMMKVTGQQSPSPSLRPELDAGSNSTPNLTLPPFNPTTRSGSGKSSDGGDDDEEIPLAILAAHGFPAKNRPPSRLAPSNSMQNLRASMHQPYMSTPGSGEHELNNRSSLPVFARNLPRDPYFGAGLVNASNRESLALGGGSVHGGPSAAGGPSPALPPGGLVGVIATEERARAMRRGSPNMQAMHENHTGFPGAGGLVGGVPRPYTMLNMNPTNGFPAPAVSATEQAQIQLSQQMTSMMQMQMQWMQQMIHIQGGQASPQQLVGPGPFPNPFISNGNMRPSSMPSGGPGFHNISPSFGGDQRTLSMLDPNIAPRMGSPAPPFVSGGIRPGTPSGQNHYAPSIAPSERSNVGLASRYRPVSIIQPEIDSNPYPTSKVWNDENRRASTLPPSNLNKVTVRPISSHSKPLGTTKQPEPDDDDDDEGWAEMMKKRERKRSNWKIKKESTGFGDLLNAVH